MGSLIGSAAGRNIVLRAESQACLKRQVRRKLEHALYVSGLKQVTPLRRTRSLLPTSSAGSRREHASECWARAKLDTSSRPTSLQESLKDCGSRLPSGATPQVI